MKKHTAYLILAGALTGSLAAAGDGALERGFAAPPAAARLHAYWWWLNGNVTAEAITRDLEAMRQKGFGGALITDAGGDSGDGNKPVPHGPDFGSEAWRELYRHALREGARLKLEMALNIQSGWNLGGPSVTPEDAAKILCYTETVVEGPGPVTAQLPAPQARSGLLREVAVVAVPDRAKKAFPNWEVKALYQPVGGANADLSMLVPAKPAPEEDRAPDSAQVKDLSQFVDAKGNLTWAAPAGTWRVYRFCYTVGPRATVSTSSQGWSGLALDPMDAGAYQRYWDAVVEPLMADARQVGGSTLKYLHTDSWEIEPFNWTEKLPEAFKKRCGYDLKPWLPVLARCAVGGTEASERFLHDFRKTVAALVAENHYGPFLKNAHRHGLQVRAESGGPHGVPIDAQHCLGLIDAPMSEFWATSWRHRVPDRARFFVKQPASAAHTYGKKIVAAEGFTTIGPHWQETVWDNLKPNFDRALCEGLNQLVWTLLTCSPKEMGLPGQEMFPGTHFNPNSTWWRQSEGFLTYINRCQWMLRQGLFVGDALYYYGDLAPNFAGLKALNPAGLPPGYDYDVASEYVLLNRVSVKAGRIVLPDGMSYGALVLPPHRTASPAVLRKLRELAEAGAILVGPRPDSSSGLMEWQKGDAGAKELISQLWGNEAKRGLVRHGTAADWLKSAGLVPDFEAAGGAGTNAPLDYIHRQDGETEIYFVASRQAAALRADCLFRVKDKQAELWDPVTGEMRDAAQSASKDGRSAVSLDFVPYGSVFVVFRGQGSGVRVHQEAGGNFPELKPVQELTGSWEVNFDPAWFYGSDGARVTSNACSFVFDELSDWTDRSEPGIKYYSGLATYRKTFDSPEPRTLNPLFLSLGAVREMARVRLNGRDLGVVWCPPWSVRIPAGALKEKDNRLEIEVVNFWPNRLIGDAGLPPAQRRTRTNISKFYEPKGDAHYTTLMPSGLLGPVALQRAE